MKKYISALSLGLLVTTHLTLPATTINENALEQKHQTILEKKKILLKKIRRKIKSAITS